MGGLFSKKKADNPARNGKKKTKPSRRETIIITVMTVIAVGAVVFLPRARSAA